MGGLVPRLGAVVSLVPALLLTIVMHGFGELFGAWLVSLAAALAGGVATMVMLPRGNGWKAVAAVGLLLTAGCIFIAVGFFTNPI